MTTVLHDPVPDGKTGPFMRLRHATMADGITITWDPRCDGCQADCPVCRAPAGPGCWHSQEYQRTLKRSE